MISDIDLCKDIAEFAHFSIALRGGLPTQAEFDTRQQKKASQKRVPATANGGAPQADNPGCLGRLFGG